jgi:hypothetical protein
MNSELMVAPPAVNKKTLEEEIQTLDSRMMRMPNAVRTLEFEEAKKFAGSGPDLPDFLFGPRGVIRCTAHSARELTSPPPSRATPR